MPTNFQTRMLDVVQLQAKRKDSSESIADGGGV